MANRLLEIAVVSRNEIEREGLRQILTDRAFKVTGVYRDHLDLDFDNAVAGEVPPLVLINSAGEEETIETCRYIHDHWPALKIVIFTTNLQGQAVLDAFNIGIDGYVGKQVSVECLAQMLNLVALGEKMIPSQAFFELPAAHRFAEIAAPSVAMGDANLSDRELQILQGLVRGEANKVISRQMAITEATVKVHVKSILRKLGVVNRTQAAIWAMTRGVAKSDTSGMNGFGSSSVSGTELRH